MGAVVPILINVGFPGSDTLPEYLRMGVHSDTTPAWYGTVGLQLTLTMGFNVVTSHFGSLWAAFQARQKMIRGAELAKDKLIIQADLNDAAATSRR